MRTAKAGLIVLALALPAWRASAQDAQLVRQAEQAMAKATAFFTDKVAHHGGYLGEYLPDLSDQWGEGHATRTQMWVQPPGAPSVGFAFLEAWKATGDERYLDAAKAVAEALAWGQLECGGWDYIVDFDPQGAKRWFYRHDKEAGESGEGRRNQGTFDDNTTQHAMRLLMAVDKTVGFKDPYHAAALYGLDYMMRAQFDNGAWPQRFPLSSKGYSRWYTFNDNAINDCIDVMWIAYETYGDDKYLERAKKGGDFIILSQLKPPQAGWGQQYDWDMKPAWARKFEPPGVNGACTSRNIRTLVQLYLNTGEEKYLKPIPDAIAWLNRSKIGDNLWARFYEIGTNRPLYMNKKYELVYTDDDMPTHYSFQSSYGVPGAISFYEKVKKMGREAYIAQRDREPTTAEKRNRAGGMEPQVQKIIAALDEQGRWISNGRIRCQTFNRNLGALSRYVELAEK